MKQPYSNNTRYNKCQVNVEKIRGTGMEGEDALFIHVLCCTLIVTTMIMIQSNYHNHSLQQLVVFIECLPCFVYIRTFNFCNSLWWILSVPFNRWENRGKKNLCCLNKILPLLGDSWNSNLKLVVFKEIEKMYERSWNTKFLRRNSINVERRPHISGSAFMLKYWSKLLLLWNN